MIFALFYVCATLTGGEALACGAPTASEPPQRVQVFAQACGRYMWPGGSAFVDCGHNL